ncbi:GGDEF domain-containing protein [Deinococcus roseus]|uniref:GGDEF domain-containing protein n=1 Tax=Deinococcus roseus TaxID=392414 RepID=A0ABQ2DCA6_9DEIO|nr:GGDEF domain-containing protein [Deinococcus roseus]GGJ52807.1 hypothetical protein GCM10008938_43490 [Deinococcus roseus]
MTSNPDLTSKTITLIFNGDFELLDHTVQDLTLLDFFLSHTEMFRKTSCGILPATGPAVQKAHGYQRETSAKGQLQLIHLHPLENLTWVQLEAELKHANAMLEVMAVLADPSLSAERWVTQVIAHISQAAQADGSFLAVQQGDTMVLCPPQDSVLLAQNPVSQARRARDLLWQVATTGVSVCHDHVQHSPENLPLFLGFDPPDLQSVAMLSLTPSGSERALVFCAYRLGVPWNTGVQDMFERALMALRTALEKRRQWRQLQTAATHDGLTGLANRSAFERDLDLQMAQSLRHGHPLGVLVLDIDGLKKINDEHGHLRGDQLLQSFSRGLRRHMRIGDVCYRLGGDEFAVMLTHSAVGNRRALQKRIRLVMQDVHHQGFKSAGVSLGLAFFPQEGQTPQALLKLADERMYLMKKLHHQHP